MKQGIDRKLKVGIVGCGKIADGHAEEIHKIGSAELVCVCDREPIMAEQLAVRHNVPLCYSDMRRMLDEQGLDIVHITTPPQSHLPLARMAFEAGAHVFVEKPVAPTLAETEALLAAAQVSGRKLTVNYWYNFERIAEQLRTLIVSGELGDIVHIESSYGYDLSGAYGHALMADRDHWVHQLPGGFFQNVMDHVVNKIVPLLPDAPADIQTVAFSRRTGDNPFPDELRVNLQCGAISAYATVSANARPVAHIVRVYGTKNTAHVDFTARTLILDVRQSLPSALGRLIPPFVTTRRYLRNSISNCKDFVRSRSHFFHGMNRLFSLFYESILHDTEPPISLQDMRRVAAILEEVFAAITPEVTA